MSESDERIRRQAVRVVIFDSNDSVLLLSTRDASNPEFGTSWELPGGGLLPQESISEAAVREVFEETGLHIDSGDLSETLWRREVYYTYRGESRLQHESICTVKMNKCRPKIDISRREDFELEDHLCHRWWSKESLLASNERFYPCNIPQHFDALLSGLLIDDPIERWD